MRRVISGTLLAVACGCTNAGNESIELPFVLLSSDQLQTPTAGTPCTYQPVTSSGSDYAAGGFVDLDPAVNPSPGYQLGVQVENYLSSVVLSDSNGNTVTGANENDFLIQDVVVNYVPEQQFLSPPGCLPGPPSAAAACASGGGTCCLPEQGEKFFTSGRVQPGGLQSALAVVSETLSAEVVQDLQANLQAYANGGSMVGLGGTVMLQIQVEGTLASGEPMVSGTLNFPLHVCYDCLGASPASCVNGVTASPGLEHGPCCAPHDFGMSCVACGAAGQPCCAMPDNVPMPCQQDSDCTSFGLGGAPGDCVVPAGASGGTCQCQPQAGSSNPNSDCAAFGASSVCQANGTCAPGCNGPGVACGPATSLPPGFESCGYPNSQAETSVCGS